MSDSQYRRRDRRAQGRENSILPSKVPMSSSGNNDPNVKIPKHIPFKNLRAVSRQDPTGHLFQRFEATGGSDPDAIEVVSTKYNPKDFLVEAANAAGQSTRAQCKIPPLLGRQIQEFVACRKFPFRTDSDVIRWCIYHGLQALGAMEPLDADFLMRALAEIEVLRDGQLWSLKDEYIRALENAVRRCTDAGQWTEAFRIVMSALARMKDAPDDVWKNIYIKDIETRFKHVLDYDRRRRD
jgi:hypothetical protein